MRTFFRIAVLWLAAVLLAGAQDPFYLRDGDRVVFYGDSITDQRLYTTFTETYALTRFPELKVQFVHSGWGGDRVTGGGGGPIDLRLRRDVFAYRPTVFTCMLGMNDGGVRPFDPALFQTFTSGYENIVNSVRNALPGVRITLIQPSPYDDVTRPPLFEGGYNAVLVRYGEYLKGLAQRGHLDIADLNTPVVAALRKAYASDPKLAQRIVPDRVHPGPGGHLLMAEALLKAWHAPAVVTSVELDAATGRVARAVNTEVAGLRTEGGFSWTQTDRALPMPVDLKDPVVSLTVRSSDFVEALDRELLTITGLTAAGYVLKIDGEQVGRFTAQQLAEGVNLAVLDTPMARQAMAVHALTLKHNNVHFARWRQVQVPLQDDQLANKQAAIDALDRLESELVSEQRAAAQPKPHSYELQPE